MNKVCNICGKEYPATTEYFYLKFNKNPEKGFQSSCKKCWKERSIKRQRENWNEIKPKREEWEKNNPDKNVKIRRKKWNDKHYLEWQRNNKDKVKEYNQKYSHKKHNITKEQWKICKEYFGNECCYCGISEKEAKKKYKQNLHKEHFDDDGANDLSNCVPACKSCNSSKWNFEVDEWYLQQEFFSQDRLDKINQWLNNDYKLFL